MTEQFEPVLPLVRAAAIEPVACRRVALVLALEQDSNGGSLSASMASLSSLVGMSPGQTRKHVHALVAMDVLQVLANANGGSPQALPQYRFNALRLRALAEQPGKTHDLFHSSPVPRTRFFAADGEDSEDARLGMAMELHGRAGDRSIRFFRESPQGDIAYGWAPLQMLMRPLMAKGAWTGWLNPEAGAPVWALSVYTFPEIAERLQRWAQEIALGRSEAAAGHAHRQTIEQKGNPYGH